MMVRAFVLAVIAIAAPAAARDYFVSSSSGDDRSAGTDSSRPWQSLARVSEARFEPGDRILLRADDRFVGQLRLRASGSPGRPITVSRFGAGGKPVIDGGADPLGGWPAAILIRNQQHIAIADLEIVNSVDKPRPGARADRSFGILVVNDGGGVLRGFRLERLTIRDIFAPKLSHGSEDQFNSITTSAIRFLTETNKAGAPPSYFEDIVVADNQISRTGRFGVIVNHNGRAGRPDDAHSRDAASGFNQSIVIRDNRFDDLGGSAVQISGGRFVLIENNDFNRSGSLSVPARMVGRGSGAWIINCRDVVAQRNRSRHIRGYKDSYGMHVDFGNLNVLFQYNYSHDSEGGFVEILGNNRNVIWRYNLSINDGLREKSGNTIWLSTWSPGRVPSQGIHIYNNTVFVRSGLYPDLDFQARDARISNNIFYVSREAMIGETLALHPAGVDLQLAGNLFRGNIAAQFRVRDAAGRNADPLFLNPGGTEPADYRIALGSPAADGGVEVAHPGFPAAGQGVFAGVSEVPTVDFFGQRIAGTSRAIGFAAAQAR